MAHLLELKDGIYVLPTQVIQCLCVLTRIDCTAPNELNSESIDYVLTHLLMAEMSLTTDNTWHEVNPSIYLLRNFKFNYSPSYYCTVLHVTVDKYVLKMYNVSTSTIRGGPYRKAYASRCAACSAWRGNGQY